MIKLQFIAEIAALLKTQGFRKHRNYWYRIQNDLLLCVNVQGSQWDKNNYYVEIGAARLQESAKNPPVLSWLFCHRCKGPDGKDLNISLADCLQDMESVFCNFSSYDQLKNYLTTIKAVRVVNQFWF